MNNLFEKKKSCNVLKDLCESSNMFGRNIIVLPKYNSSPREGKAKRVGGGQYLHSSGNGDDWKKNN